MTSCSCLLRTINTKQNPEWNLSVSDSFPCRLVISVCPLATWQWQKISKTWHCWHTLTLSLPACPWAGWVGGGGGYWVVLSAGQSDRGSPSNNMRQVKRLQLLVSYSPWAVLSLPDMCWCRWRLVSGSHHTCRWSVLWDVFIESGRATAHLQNQAQYVKIPLHHKKSSLRSFCSKYI